MGNNCGELKAVHKFCSCLSSAFDAETYNSAGAVWHIFLCDFVLTVALEHCTVNPCDFRMFFEILSNGFCVLTVALNSQMQALESYIKQKCFVRRLYGAEVSHKLYGCLGNICALAECFGIYNAVVTVIRCGETGELVILSPVEVTAVNYCTADC